MPAALATERRGFLLHERVLGGRHVHKSYALQLAPQVAARAGEQWYWRQQIVLLVDAVGGERDASASASGSLTIVTTELRVHGNLHFARARLVDLSEGALARLRLSYGSANHGRASIHSFSRTSCSRT